jgi:hypothetical protein
LTTTQNYVSQQVECAAHQQKHEHYDQIPQISAHKQHHMAANQRKHMQPFVHQQQPFAHYHQHMHH